MLSLLGNEIVFHTTMKFEDLENLESAFAVFDGDEWVLPDWLLLLSSAIKKDTP